MFIWSFLGKKSHDVGISDDDDDDSGNEDTMDGLNPSLMKTMKREWQSASMMRNSNKYERNSILPPLTLFACLSPCFIYCNISGPVEAMTIHLDRR